MKFIAFILVNIFGYCALPLLAFGESTHTVSESERQIDTSNTWIGKLNINNRAECTAWILKHGVAVTAKHCFLHKDLNEFFANQYVSHFSIEFFLKVTKC